MIFNKLKEFITDTAGVAAIIFAFSIPLIIGSAGIGVDVAKAYHTKNKLEKTLDAAALAAASTNKEGRELEKFVKNYVESNFRESGYSTVDLTNLSVNHNKENKTIEIRGEATSTNTFMGMLPFNNPTVTVAARSVSKESITGVEVALVLDNSESMSFDRRIDDLQDAAKNFVDTLYDAVDVTGGKIKIGIVPYGSFVNVGPYGLGYDSESAFVKNPEGLVYRPTKDDSSGKHWSGCVFEHGLYDDKDGHTPEWTMYKKCHDLNGNRIYKGWECNPTKRELTEYGFKQNCTYSEKKDCSYKKDGVDVPKKCRTCERICLTASCEHKYKDVPNNPNIHGDCISTTVQPMVMNTEPNSRNKLKNAISKLRAEANQQTQSDLGMAWGYHVLSPERPFKEGEDWSSSTWKKVIIFMTDGLISGDFYGPYYGKPANSDRTTERARERFTDMCNKSKAKGVLVYTIQFGDIGDEALLTSCATDTTKALKATSGADLSNTFVQIAEDLGNVYLAK